MDWNPVESSNIAAIGHEGTSLYVRFKNQSEYSYDDVPTAVFHEFLSAKSQGRFFVSSIRGKFRHHMIKAPANAAKPL